MGFLETLFGGSSVMDTSTPEIRGYAQKAGNFNAPMANLGIAGKVAKGYLKDVRAGRMDQLPSVMLAKSQGARNWTDLQRNVQMSTAMMPGEQSGLTAGILNKGMLANQDATGAQSLQGAANDISNFSQIFNQAKANKESTNTARMGLNLEGMLGAGNMLSANRKVVQKKGLISGLADIAGMLGPLGAGLKGLKGGGNAAGYDDLGGYNK